jgi:hypothetical protein
VHVAHEAARAVSALLHFAAVGIENAVVEVRPGLARRLDLEDLVAADAEMPVGEESQLIRTQFDRPRAGVEHDEIVAQALHFCEFELHDPSNRSMT